VLRPCVATKCILTELDFTVKHFLHKNFLSLKYSVQPHFPDSRLLRLIKKFFSAKMASLINTCLSLFLYTAFNSMSLLFFTAKPGNSI